MKTAKHRLAQFHSLTLSLVLQKFQSYRSKMTARTLTSSLHNRLTAAIKHSVGPVATRSKAMQ